MPKHYKEMIDEIINKMDEDAPANAVAHGGVDMAPNAGKKKKKDEVPDELKKVIMKRMSGKIKEDKRYEEYQSLIEQTVIKFLKENNLYEDILNESREIPEFETDDQVFCTCFGVDVYNRDEELVSEYEYAKTL